MMRILFVLIAVFSLTVAPVHFNYSTALADEIEFDADGDGYNDDVEMLAGTDPNDSDSVPDDMDDDGLADVVDPDIDGDGIFNTVDEFPNDPAEHSDHDNDNIGDNSDPDIDGDNYLNIVEIFAGSDPNDEDSVPADMDEDYLPDVLDPDMDGDGVLNTDDAYPEDPAATTDITLPVVISPAAVTVEATGTATIVTLGTATATDDLDGTLIPSSDAPAGGFPVGATTVTYTATDAAGNAGTATQLVTVTDTTAPVVTAPAAVTADSADGNPVTVTLGAATATDLFTVTVTSDAPATFPVGVTTVTWTATDANGNSATATQLVTVNQGADMDGDGIPDATDPDIDGDGVPNALDMNPADPAIGADVTAPVVTAPVAVTIEAVGSSNTVTLGLATAADNFDPAVTVTNDAPATFPVGTTTVTYTTTDAAGNIGTATQVVTVTDTTAPAITAPTAVTAESTDGSPVAATTGTATATDLFTVTVTNDAPPTFAVGTTTVTWTATDTNGNSATATQLVTISLADTTPPVVTAPAAVTVEATGTTNAVTLGVATASDVVDGAIVPTSDAPATFPVGITTVTYTATDAAGNAATATQIVTVTDTTVPTLSLIGTATVTVEAGSSYIDAGTTAIDLVDGDMSAAVITTGAVDTTIPGDYLLTYNVSDAVGNAAVAVTRTVTVADTTAPVIAAPAAVTASSGDNLPVAVALGAATASDVVDGAISPTNDAPATFPVGVTTVTYTAADTAGNAGTAIQLVTVNLVDVTAPTVAAPIAVTVEATGATTSVTLGAATASDVVDGALVPTSDAPETFPVGITTVTYTATDAAGNTATTTQTVTVADTIAPVITAPAAVIASSGDNLPAAVTLGTATATDIVDSTVAVTNDAPATFPVGTTTVTYTATDAAGNAGTATQLVTVNLVDITAPVVVAPVAVTVEATGISNTVALGAASATDVVDGIVAVSSDAPASFPLGTTTVAYSAADAAGNTATGTQLVTVVDTTAPVITAPVEASGTSGDNQPVSIVIGQATATDAFAVTIANDAPATYPVGTTTVIWTGTDSNGNVSTAIQLVTVNLVDTTAPTVTAPAAITMEATGASTAVTLDTASATDVVDGVIVPSSDAPATFPVGVTTVTYTAIDAAGNTATATQAVTVADTIAPVITVPAAVIASSGDNLPVTVVLGAATATDIVDGTLVSTSDAPATFPVGTTTVTYSVTDAAGNTGTATQLVTVNLVDITAPVVTAPAVVTVEATGPTTAVTLGVATASDVVDGAIVPSSDAPAIFPVGITTVTYTAIDAAGNTATATQIVTVTDTTAPVITAPAAVTASSGDNLPVTVVLGAATATDIVDGTLVSTSDAPAIFPVGTTTVTYSVTDAAGNISTATQLVTVNLVDVTAPTVTAPVAVTVEATGITTSVTFGAATASDVVDGAIVPTNDAPATFPVGTTTVTYTATDVAGNISTATQLVTVADTTAPTVTTPADVTAVSGDNLPVAVTLGTATATDLFAVTVTNDAPVTYPVGTTTVTWTVTDANGNSSTATQFVTVTLNDVTPPTITPPANIAAEATGTNTSVNLGTATATDIVDGVMSVTNDAPASFPLGATTVTYSATDAAGNISTATQLVTVADTTAPVITTPVDASDTSGDNQPVSVTIGTATATDLFAVTVTNDAPSTFAVGTTTVTWTATDANGNSSAATQLVTVTLDDVTPPSIATPSVVTAEATGTNTSVTLGTASATDIVDGIVAVSSDAPASFPLGVTTVTYSAVDAAGNTSTATQLVTVVDTTVPVITAPADASGTSGDNQPVSIVIGDATATDAFAVTITNDAPATYPVGTSTVTWTATDANGNTSTATQLVIVSLNDVTPPSIALPADITAEATGTNTSVSLGAATALDIVDGAVSVTSDAPAIFPLGATTVTYSATDAAGNIATATQLVTVVDTTPPVVSVPADVSTTSGDNQPVSTAIGQASATDTFAVTITNDAPTTYPVGATTVTWTATDANGNNATAAQLVTVTLDDVTPPSITTPAAVTAEASGTNTSVSLGSATASDIVDGVVNVTSDAPASFPLGTTTVTYSAIDAAGNMATAIQLVTVLDTTVPVVTAPADATGTSGDNQPISVVIGQAAATDTFAVTIANDAPVTYPVGTTTVTWTGTDSNGNVSTATQLVTVNLVDVTAPVITAPAAVTASSGDNLAVAVTLGAASASDLVDGTVAVTNDAPATFPVGVTTVTHTATDAAGNVGTATQLVTVNLVDITAPVVTAPAAITMEATDITTPVILGTATATDVVDGAIVPSSDAPAAFPVGATTVTYSAMDAAGNSGTATQQVTITDTIVPIITGPANVIADSINGNDPVVTLGTATATDIFNITITNNAPATFSVGVTTVIWSATDANGNISAATQLVTVNLVDTIAPVITSPADVFTSTNSSQATVSLGTATASDNVDGVVAVTNNAPASFPVGASTVTYTSTDTAGNTATATQQVYVSYSSTVDGGSGGGGTTTPPAAGGGATVGMEAVYWHHNDHLGTPQALTDASGTKVWGISQTPFGITTVNEDPDGDGITVTNNFRFPGQYFDIETELNYNYFRTYDPALGRYTQSDPIGIDGGLNSFAYVGGNPIMRYDPLGLFEESCGCPSGKWTSASKVSASAFFGGGGSVSKTIYTCKSNTTVCSATSVCFGGGPIVAAGVGFDVGEVKGVTNSDQLEGYASGVYATVGPVSGYETGNGGGNVGVSKSWGAGAAYVTCTNFYVQCYK